MSVGKFRKYKYELNIRPQNYIDLNYLSGIIEL